MKKVLWLFTIIALLGCMFVLPSIKVKAEEIEQPETTETEEITEQDEKEIKDYVVDVADKYLGKYVDKQTLTLIINLSLTALSYLGMFVINLVYNKYKKGNTNTIIESFKKIDGEHIKTQLKNAYEKIDTLEKVIVQLKESHETMMKVFVLSQDKSVEGKVAMLEYIGKHTQNDEVQEKAQEISGELEKEVEVKQEVNEKVKDEYQEIF